MSLYCISKDLVAAYETTEPVFRAVYREVQELSKKKPDGILSKAKISMINRIIDDLLKMLSETPSVKYLGRLDEDDLPQYSDVVLLLSQFGAALDSFHERHYGNFYGERQWVTREAEAAAKKRSGS
jgi:hypothetical protein